MSGNVSAAGHRGRWYVAAFVLVVAAVAIQSGSAGTTALFDGPAARAACTTSYPGVTGPDELSPCQWDMQAIHAGAAHDTATGEGVRVGVIDGGVDFTHPDLAGAIDVAASCSFIYSATPTADPQEMANGDCSNKTAVQDLQGHGTHVATTIAGQAERDRHRRRRAATRRSSRSRRAPSSGSASPTRSPPRCATPVTSGSTW